MFDKETRTVKVLDLSSCRESLFEGTYRRLLTPTGCELFRAPESFDSTYSKEVDLWAAGVILFLLIFRRHPFHQPGYFNLISMFLF